MANNCSCESVRCSPKCIDSSRMALGIREEFRILSSLRCMVSSIMLRFEWTATIGGNHARGHPARIPGYNATGIRGVLCRTERTALWYVALRDAPVNVVRVRDPKGYRQDEAFFLKSKPSFFDMLTAARRAGWRLYVSDPPSRVRRRRKSLISWHEAVLSTA